MIEKHSLDTSSRTPIVQKPCGRDFVVHVLDELCESNFELLKERKVDTTDSSKANFFAYIAIVDNVTFGFIQWLSKHFSLTASKDNMTGPDHLTEGEMLVFRELIENNFEELNKVFGTVDETVMKNLKQNNKK